jgi:hypothetical protein
MKPSAMSNRRASRALLAAALAASALLLAGCSSEPPVAETVASQLPDLSEYGYTEFECGSGVTINDDFISPEPPYVAHCWKGAQDDPFVWVADDLKTSVVQATEGVDATAQACAEDVLNEAAGIACRAVYVGKEGNEVLVRIIVTLADIDAVMAKVPGENPTSEDVVAALAGADLEVLIGTEPIPAQGATPAPSASPSA